MNLHRNCSAALADFFELQDLVAPATLGVQEVEDFLKSLGAGAIAQKATLTFLTHQTLVTQRIEMMRQCRRRDLELCLQLSNHQARRMSRKKESDDLQPSFMPQGREPICENDSAIHYISRIIELSGKVKSVCSRKGKDARDY